MATPQYNHSSTHHQALLESNRLSGQKPFDYKTTASASSILCLIHLAASARSTRNAACQHAVSSHSGFAIQRIMWMHFLNKRTALATLRPTGAQNRTAAANAFFPVHKSSSATSASEQLLGLLLLKELSEAGAFSAPLAWVTPPVQRPPGLPPCQRQRRTPRPQRIA